MKTTVLKSFIAFYLSILTNTVIAATATVNGITWYYTVSNGEATIGGGWNAAIATSTSGSISIPSKLGNSLVASIGQGAFYGCKGITSVTIPESVTSIGDSAFSGCSGLTSVTIPDSVTSIGESAFYGCSGLTSFSVDANNRNYASANDLLLSKDGKTLTAGVNGDVVIPDSVTSIGTAAFSGCNSALFDTSTIPGVKLVDGWAIGYESTLSGSLDLTGIRGFVSSSFYGCSGLTSVTIPDSVTSIGDSAFYNCSGLRSEERRVGKECRL